jgi:hypothetical protein
MSDTGARSWAKGDGGIPDSPMGAVQTTSKRRSRRGLFKSGTAGVTSERHKDMIRRSDS